MLQKISYEQIPWIEEGKLYRGTFQSAFELSVLKQLKKGFQYFGFLDSHEGEMSSTSKNWDDAVHYSIMRNPEYCVNLRWSDREPSWPFSRYPLVMEINAEKYKDRLYAGLEWPNEVVIKGPISLEDITILFASNINKLREIRNVNDNLLRNTLFSIEQCLVEKNFLRDHNLFKYLEQDRESVICTLNMYAFGMRLYQQMSETERLNEFLDIMREKFKAD